MFTSTVRKIQLKPSNARDLKSDNVQFGDTQNNTLSGGNDDDRVDIEQLTGVLCTFQGRHTVHTNQKRKVHIEGHEGVDFAFIQVYVARVRVDIACAQIKNRR